MFRAEAWWDGWEEAHRSLPVEETQIHRWAYAYSMSLSLHSNSRPSSMVIATTASGLRVRANG